MAGISFLQSLLLQLDRVASPAAPVANSIGDRIIAASSPPVPEIISTYSKEAVGVEIGDLVATGATPSDLTWPAANRVIWVPIRLQFSFTVARFFVVNAGTVAGNLDLAVVNAAGTLQGTTAGATAQAGTYAVQLAAPSGGNFTLAAGLYMMGVGESSATATVRGYGSGEGIYDIQPMGVRQSSVFPIVTGVTFAALANTPIPLFGITSRTAM